jgi:hypothetical protein
MPEGFHGVLLYPHIDLKDPLLIKESLLFYDNIYRIVPSSHPPKDADLIREFIEEYGIIRNIDPKPFSENASNSFQEKIEHYSRAAGFKYGVDGPDYDRLHKDKVYDKLRQTFISRKLLEYDGTWLKGNSALITQYMMYLALEISQRNELSLTTTSIPAWTSSEYLNYDGVYADTGSYHTHKQIGFYLKDYLPDNLGEIDFKSIVEFRDEHREERKNFLKSYKKYHESLSSIASNKVRVDAILDNQENLSRSISDFKSACHHTWASSFYGFKVVTIPIATEIASKFVTLNPTTEIQLLGGGIALGLVWTLYSANLDYHEIKKKNPNSYLVTLKKHSFESSSDLNQCLRSNVLEYWED